MAWQQAMLQSADTCKEVPTFRNMHNYGKIIGWVCVALDLAMCVAYGYERDWRRCAYWFFAAGITASVTW